MPRAQSPTREQGLQQVLTQIRVLLRAKQNTSNVWNYGEAFVEITPDENTYQISDASFGTPLVVTALPQNPNQVARIVPFYCPQNLVYSYGWPQNAGAWLGQNWDGNNANALRCAIFWQNNLPYIRFEPTPVLSPAVYKVDFLASANHIGQLALTATPLVDQDIDLVEIRAAKGLLALAQWESPSTKEGRQINAERRKDLFVTLGGDEQLTVEQFLIGNRITTGGNRITNRWSSCTE